jgi:sterol desaturase/sphingolipid hydroxylase (fatty acid hydroxylase superfamily)
MEKTMRKYLTTAGWAAFVTGSIGLCYYGLTHGWGLALTLLAQGAATFIVCIIAELVVPFRRDWQWLGDRQVFTDIAHTLLFDQSINNAYAIGTVLVATYVMPVATNDNILMIVLGVAYVEISEYWRHRFLHASDTFWPVHALHHHLDRMHIFRSGRVHFADGIARVVFTFIPALLLGAPPMAIACWMILLTATGPISHSNLNIYTPRWINWLITTPMVHRVHHANEDALMRSNLAPSLPVVDMIFDTWLAPEGNPVKDVGITPDFMPTGFFGQLATPFVHIFGGRPQAVTEDTD